MMHVIRDTSGEYREVSSKEVIDLARSILERDLRGKPAMESPQDSKDFCMVQLGQQEREVFAVLFLDNRHRLIQYEELFFGTIDTASVHPREVCKRALLLNAAAVIITHNHPSGTVTPSAADERITQRLKEALALLDVRVLDHIIVGGAETHSFAETGRL